MPSFAAKVYEQMAVVRTEKHEKYLESLRDNFQTTLMTVVPAGHTIGTPEPIFREIKDSEKEVWQKKFGGE